MNSISIDSRTDVIKLKIPINKPKVTIVAILSGIIPILITKTMVIMTSK